LFVYIQKKGSCCCVQGSEWCIKPYLMQYLYFKDGEGFSNYELLCFQHQ
jgi:hypothetical protein